VKVQIMKLLNVPFFHLQIEDGGDGCGGDYSITSPTS
jgi:hypothetical protein